METLVVGGLCALSFLLASLLWQALVDPGVLLSMFDDRDLTGEAWEQESDVAVAFLRWTLAGLVLVFGFLTGLALVFLTGTG